MAVPVVLLAGGLGTRLKEETEIRPKPMIEVGGLPILWHIMKIFAAHGHKEFVICLGYKGEIIKDFFLNYSARHGSLTVDLGSGERAHLDRSGCEDWKVHLLETGANTMTGGRVKRAAAFLGNRRFFMTYGDGVANVDINALLAFHERTGKSATLTAVRPPARFGGLKINNGLVEHFEEKPQLGEGWINGGYMVFEPSVADHIESDATFLEREPLEAMADAGQLAAYQHSGFWQCMDTVRDLDLLRDLWDKGVAPWRNW